MGAWTKAKNKVENTQKDAKNSVEDAWTGAKNSVEDSYKDVKNKVDDTYKDVKNKVDDTYKDVKNTYTDVKNKTEDALADLDAKILQPIEKTAEAIATDPKALAAIALAVYAPGLGSLIGESIGLSGTTAAIVGNTVVNTALNGGDVKKGLTAALVPVVGGSTANYVTGALASTGMNTVISTVVGNMAGSVATAALTGTSVNDALKMGLAASVPGVLNSNSTFAALPSVIKAPIIASISASIAGQDVKAAAIGGLIQGANIVGNIVQASPTLTALVQSSASAAAVDKIVTGVVNATLTGVAQGKTTEQVQAMATNAAKTTSVQILTSPQVKDIAKETAKAAADALKTNKAAAFDQQVAAMKVDQLSNVDLQAERDAYINDPKATLQDATSAVQTAATKSDQDKVGDIYQDFKKTYAGDISDEDLKAAAQAQVMKAEGKGDGVSIDAYAMRAFNAQSAADQAAQKGLSYEAQREIKNSILDQDISSWSKNKDYQYDASGLIKAAESANSLGMEFAKADAKDGTPAAEVSSQYIRDQEARDSQLWIQDQADMIGMKDSAAIKDIVAKIDSGEYNSAEAYDAFRKAEAAHADETIQKDPTAKTAYDSALKYAKDNGLKDDAAAKQWAYDIATGLKNYQDFNTIKALPETAAELAKQAKDMYGLSDADAKAISDRVLSGELNYNDALTVSKNVSMARQLGDTSADLVNDAPTVADKGAELELKAANFEEQYGITADTPEEKAALEVAKNNILNNIDSQAVYNDYMSGKYAEIDLTSPTPTTVNEDGVNEPIVDEEPFTYPVVPDFKPDYSLNPEDPTKIGIDPETGTGLTGTAFTGVSDLVDPNWTPDYSLYNPTSGSTDGQGLKLPTTSNLEDMGGGQGLTSGEVGAGESTDGLTVDLSGKDAVTPEDLTDPSLVGVDDSNYKLDPLEVETQTPGNIVAVGTPKKPATDSNLPRGSDIAPKPANASATNPDGTEAVPTWKSALLTPGLLTSTYNPNADYSFKGTYTPQAIDISQQTPLQQINPVFQQQQPQTDTTTMPQTQNTSGYYNYGVEKSPLSFDSSPFYGSSTPQVAHLRGGGLAMASPLMAAGGVPYKGSHYVQGAGGGQDDLIDARLADGEYVFDADVVAALGDGSNTEGARKLDAMRESIRKQKRSAPINRIPPKAKSPLAYLKGVK